MATAKHTLLVLSPNTQDELALIDQAKSVRQAAGEKLSFVYVVEDTPASYCVLPSVSSDLGNQQQLGRVLLKQLGDALGVRPENRWLKVGSANQVVSELVKKHSIDTVLCNSQLSATA